MTALSRPFRTIRYPDLFSLPSNANLGKLMNFAKLGQVRNLTAPLSKLAADGTNCRQTWLPAASAFKAHCQPSAKQVF